MRAIRSLYKIDHSQAPLPLRRGGHIPVGVAASGEGVARGAWAALSATLTTSSEQGFSSPNSELLMPRNHTVELGGLKRIPHKLRNIHLPCSQGLRHVTELASVSVCELPV